MSLDKKEHNSSKWDFDDQLIRGCRMNDRKAQLELYKKYYKAMYNTAYRIVRKQAEAEDAMQEAFLDAFRKIDTFRGDSTFGAWLKKIVVNKAINYARLQNKLDFIDVDDQEIPEPVQEDPVETLSFKIEMIRSAIENMPDRYRVILSLYLLEGYDHEEISGILDISYNATRTKYSRARQKLLLSLRNMKNV